MALGKNVKNLRELHGWTLKDLSKRSGVPVGTIGALEVRDSVRSEYAANLAEAFRLTIEDLLSVDAKNREKGVPNPDLAAATEAFFSNYPFVKGGYFDTAGITKGQEFDLLSACSYSANDLERRKRWTDEIIKFHREKDAFLKDRYPNGFKNKIGFSTNTEDAGKPLAAKKTPVVGTARMGDLGYYDEMPYPTGHGDGWVDSYSPDPNAYALRVKGDSMHPAIRHGSFVVVEPNGPCVPGEYVVLALIDGRKMVKELVRQNEVEIVIESVNGNHRQTIEISEIEKMHPVAAIVSASKWRAD